MPLCQAVIRINPIGKGRPRFGRGKTYTPDATREWEDAVALLVQNALRRKWSWVEMPICGPIRMSLNFYVQRPDSHYKADKESLRSKSPRHHTSKPDVDNMAKAFLDALQKGGIIADDAAVVQLYARKEWSSAAGISFSIERETVREE